MAISILDPLVDKAGGIRKTAAWYRNAVSSIADRTSARRLMGQGKLIGRPSVCLLYTSPSPRDLSTSRMPSSA